MRKLKTHELNRLSTQDFGQLSKFPIVIVLDNLRSMYNIGSIFRTCDAFKVDVLYLCGICAKPPNRAINKTAIGATESVQWFYHESTEELLKKLTEDYIILAIEHTDQSIHIQDYNFNKLKKYAFIFGNEFSGIEEKNLTYVDDALEVPQFGTKHSLNVSVCVGVILWQYVCDIIS